MGVGGAVDRFSRGVGVNRFSRGGRGCGGQV